MTFDRVAFESAVAEFSPLLPCQFDTLFGNVTADNKSLAWQFMNLPPKLQYLAFEATKHFPGSKIEAVR